MAIVIDNSIINAFRGIDTILIRQEVEAFEAVSGIETSNSYVCLGAQSRGAAAGARFRYLVCEDSSFVGRMFLGKNRSFTLRVVAVGLNDVNATGRSGLMGSEIDSRRFQQQPVFTIERQWAFFRQEIIVKSGTGQLIGTVQKVNCQCFNRDFIIRDNMNRPVFRLYQGSSFFGMLGFSPRWNWELLSSADGATVGELRKQWSGLMQELLTDADNFGIEFYENSNISSQEKILVFASVFLIDYLYFEDNAAASRSGRRRGRGRLF
jgi:hypothetical protein